MSNIIMERVCTNVCARECVCRQCAPLQGGGPAGEPAGDTCVRAAEGRAVYAAAREEAVTETVGETLKLCVMGGADCTTLCNWLCITLGA